MEYNVREFTKEGLTKSVVRLLRSGICFNYANEYADMIEDGSWLTSEVWQSIENNERVRSGRKSY